MQSAPAMLLVTKTTVTAHENVIRFGRPVFMMFSGSFSAKQQSISKLYLSTDTENRSRPNALLVDARKKSKRTLDEIYLVLLRPSNDLQIRCQQQPGSYSNIIENL